eukprot:7363096-Prymnesium_polylepis.1
MFPSDSVVYDPPCCLRGCESNVGKPALHSSEGRSRIYDPAKRLRVRFIHAGRCQTAIMALSSAWWDD